MQPAGHGTAPLLTCLSTARIDHSFATCHAKFLKRTESWRHELALNKIDHSVGGYTPSIYTDSPTPPTLIALRRPKIMAHGFRETKTTLLSSLTFNLNRVLYRKRSHGAPRWDTSEFLGLDSNGELRDQADLVAKMNDLGRVYQTERIVGNDYRSRHNVEYHDLCLVGTLPDGASIMVHVPDFVPWITYQFHDRVDMLQASQIMNNIKQSDPIKFANLTWSLERRTPSDGNTPDPENPYEVAKKLYIVVRNTDASWAASNALSLAMVQCGAVAVEDAAMKPGLRFSMETKMCPGQWYMISKWQERKSFVFTSQVEIDANVADLSACIDSDENAAQLAPGVEFYADIENIKDKSQNDTAIADPDNPKNSVVCISGVLRRCGANISYPEGYQFSVNMPRTDDDPQYYSRDAPRFEEPADGSHYRVCPITGLQIVSSVARLPDPLAVAIAEASAAAAKEQNASKHLAPILSVDETVDFGHGAVFYGERKESGIEQDDNEDAIPAESDDESDNDSGSECSVPNEAPNVRAVGLSKHDIESNFNYGQLQDDSVPVEALIKRTSLGNVDDPDLELMNKVHDKLESMKNECKDEEAVNTSGQVEADPETERFDAFAANNEANRIFNETRESPESLAARNGYEIPQWAIDQLKARTNPLEESKAGTNPALTHVITNNLRHERRIAFFYDPTLPKAHIRFIIDPLLVDDGVGLIVFAYRTEAQMLIGYRDFVVASDFLLNVGHFYRSYDYKVKFHRANVVFGDSIPVVNIARDDPVHKLSKLKKCLPLIDCDLANPSNDPLWDAVGKLYPNEPDIFARYDRVNADMSNNVLHASLKWRKDRAADWRNPANRKSVFAYMDGDLFKPVTLTRQVVSSSNTATIESIYPTFTTRDDLDSLVAIRLSCDRLKSYSLNYLSANFLKDSKMDIGIPRMDQCWAQKQYWALLVYCDYDSVLCFANMLMQDLRSGHAASAKFCYMNLADMVNRGQQSGIFAKNAVELHNRNSILVKSSVTCPSIFNGGYVHSPIGGIYPSVLSCLDFVSYYVTIIMQFNLCFTTYVKPWDDNFNAIDMSKMTPVQIAQTYREFVGRARRVYGSPKTMIRPGNRKYYECQRCNAANFALLPPKVYTLDDGQDYREIAAEIAKSASIAACMRQHKVATQAFIARMSSLPSHSDIAEGRWPTEFANLDGVRNAGVPEWMDAESHSHIVRSDPGTCSTCQSKPWLKYMNPASDQSKIVDVTHSYDPYREERYAADADYLIPRSCATMFQSDPEAYLMAGIQRKGPEKTNPDGTKEQAIYREDLLTENDDEFNAISAEKWAKTRIAVTERHFAVELKKKESKKKTARQNAIKARKKNGKAKLTDAGPDDATKKQQRYVPSMASFVLWLAGLHNNQAAQDLLFRTQSGDLELNAEDHALLERYKDEENDPALRQMNSWKAERGLARFDVKAFELYAKYTRDVGQHEYWRAIASGSNFDRADHDFRSRRGINHFGSNTKNVSDLFYGRARIRKSQAAIKDKYWDNATKKWTDPVQKQIWASKEQAQTKTKEKANSYFGATGVRTGTMSNVFVAAAITFISRGFIRYSAYVAKTRVVPDEAMFESILDFRRETLEHKDKYTGIHAKFNNRYVYEAPFPFEARDCNQTWLKPISTTTDFMDKSIESVTGVEVVYGDTDSIMITTHGQVPGDPHAEYHLMPEKRRAVGMKIGKLASDLVTANFRMHGLHIMTLDWEKSWYPFAAPDRIKKKYIGRFWSKADKHDKDTVKSWLIKRDIPKLIQNLKDPIVRELMGKMDADAVIGIITDMFDKVIASRGKIVDFENDVMPYAKTQAFKKAVYATPAAHANANIRLAQAFPGNEHAVGERIEFVYCLERGAHQPKATDRSFTTRHLKLLFDSSLPEHKALLARLSIDISYYIDNCKSVVCDVLRITNPPKPVYDMPCTFYSPSSTLAMAYYRAAPGKCPNVLPPGAPENLLFYTARMWRDEDGTTRTLDEAEFEEKREWYTKTVADYVASLWKFKPSDGHSRQPAPRVSSVPASKMFLKNADAIMTEEASIKQSDHRFKDKALKFVKPWLARCYAVDKNIGDIGTMFARLNDHERGNGIKRTHLELTPAPSANVPDTPTEPEAKRITQVELPRAKQRPRGPFESMAVRPPDAKRSKPQ